MLLRRLVVCAQGLRPRASLSRSASSAASSSSSSSSRALSSSLHSSRSTLRACSPSPYLSSSWPRLAAARLHPRHAAVRALSTANDNDDAADGDKTAAPASPSSDAKSAPEVDANVLKFQPSFKSSKGDDSVFNLKFQASSRVSADEQKRRREALAQGDARLASTGDDDKRRGQGDDQDYDDDDDDDDDEMDDEDGNVLGGEGSMPSRGKVTELTGDYSEMEPLTKLKRPAAGADAPLYLRDELRTDDFEELLDLASGKSLTDITEVVEQADARLYSQETMDVRSSDTEEVAHRAAEHDEVVADVLKQKQSFEHLFHSTHIIGVFRRRRTSHIGKIPSYTALVVAGNEDGFGGFGKGSSADVEECVPKAIQNVRKNLIFVPRFGRRTIYQSVVGRHNSSIVYMWPNRRDSGISGGKIPQVVARALGLNDITIKCVGNRNPFSVIYAIFNALSKVEDVETIARDRGKIVHQFMRDSVNMDDDSVYREKYDTEVVDWVKSRLDDVRASSIDMRKNIRDTCDWKTPAEYMLSDFFLPDEPSAYHDVTDMYLRHKGPQTLHSWLERLDEDGEEQEEYEPVDWEDNEQVDARNADDWLDVGVVEERDSDVVDEILKH